MPLVPRSILDGLGGLAAIDRSLSLRNVRTGETISVVFWQSGRFVPSSLEMINHILRDNHIEKARDIDVRLLNALFRLSLRLGMSEPFHVVSGYRSPETNAWLRSRNPDAAVNSYHITGQAADIRLPGCRLPLLFDAAASLQAGGVGYYPQGDYIHLDVGRVRRWNGSSTPVVELAGH